MGMPAAKMGDKVVATDIHIIMVPTPGGPVATPIPHPFSGTLSTGLSTNVMIENKPAAILGCGGMNTPPHIPLGGGPFQTPPTNECTVIMGSQTVLINNKPAVRNGDTANTCNDPSPLPVGKVVAVSTVLIG
ncbi:MAG TPA: PAAR domain-containing protein [Phototrophicaceae bacterium]|nr:PAAR domain-containing protein [Phototrophicaceae bacterium]